MLQDLISTIGTTIFQILRELFFVRPVLSPAWARADAPCTQTLGQFTYNYPHHDHDFAKRKWLNIGMETCTRTFYNLHVCPNNDTAPANYYEFKFCFMFVASSDCYAMHRLHIIFSNKQIELFDWIFF